MLIVQSFPTNLNQETVFNLTYIRLLSGAAHVEKLLTNKVSYEECYV